MQNTIDAKTLRRMFLAGTKNLASQQEWINELNVFPVPDGDTGTNMTLTLMSAVKEINALTEDALLDEVGKKIAAGTLKGARGNSGVIMSQLCRGFIKEIEGYEELNIDVLVSAFDRAQITAYKAVMKPKEGTMLTVAKGIAQKAAELHTEEALELNDFFVRILADAEEVLASTPDMLPVLKEAGVVDSGGQGLLEFIKGAYDAYSGKITDAELEDMEGAGPAKSSAHIKAGTGKPRKAEPVRGKKIDTANLETSDIKFGYCTEFIVNIEKKYTEKDEQALKKYLSMIGDSLVCVSMDNIIKIHVHTNDPGLAIQKGLSYGSLSSIKVDNMREEHNERLFVHEKAQSAEEAEYAEEAAAGQAAEERTMEDNTMEETTIEETAMEGTAIKETAADAPAGGTIVSEARTFGEAALASAKAIGKAAVANVKTLGQAAVRAASPEEPEKEEAAEDAILPEGSEAEAPAAEEVMEPAEIRVPRKEYGFVAVCSGEGLKNVFKNMSVDEVIEGGQTMNPSTEDILRVIESVNAENVYVLPNNGNIIMAAEQTKHLCEDKKIIVIPTKTVAQGITAVINYVPAMTIDENAARMNEAIKEIKTAEITYAVRDTTINEKQISKDDYMGLGDNGLLAVGKDADEVTLETIKEMFDEDSEIVTIYYGADATEERARAIAEQIEDEFADAEVDVVYGGQPIYHYIVSVE